MAEKEETKKRRVVTESLGWLTESTILPRKHRAIEGVGVSSIVELKAQLYHSQEEAKKSKQLSGADYHRAKSKVSIRSDVFSTKNTGVDSRALKDKLELKAKNDGSTSYAALEKKAALYNKLVKGELSDEEENEKYCVDFFTKGLEQQHSEEPLGCDISPSVPTDERDEEIDASTLGPNFIGPGRTAGVLDKEERKRFVREVHEEASQAREKVSELKQRRQEQAAANRARLKQEYLRKKLEKLKAASNATGA